MGTRRRKKDVFADIAAQMNIRRDEELIESPPPKLPRRILPNMIQGVKYAFRPRVKIDTEAKLLRELARQRKAHEKYLRNYAPPAPLGRPRLELKKFNWRIAQPADAADGARVHLGKGKWKTVTIPHYGEPLGRAVTYYRTTFQLAKSMFKAGSIWVCFGGVDYKAHAFLNGTYLGSHEGFFAPFEFDATASAHQGENTLVVKVENDAICMSNESWQEEGELYEGDKLYAATGPGYDDPAVGWHHCPPAMGIYQDCRLEARARLHISDIFVRPLLDKQQAEIWTEVTNCDSCQQNLQLRISIFGQNFRATIMRDQRFEVLPAGSGVNLYRSPVPIPRPRLWEPETPWLYRVQVDVLDVKGKLLDSRKQQFGMRSFRMDESSTPKGKFYLNGREIRLRGTNTMGHLQQAVMKKDWEQLCDDILLYKVANMNFIRLTQRPVQREIYEYCDRLGIMTQTDLPLFACLRRNQLMEAARQAGEMERLVRRHACNILVSYINEPFPDASNKPHRQLTRPELERFFVVCNIAIQQENPDRVIKAVDGDYDPPGPGLPDNHCYCGWYNGHGVDVGKLHKGYWQKVKPGWHYGCGEFGAEGLDPVSVMRKYYPEHWLPQTPSEEATWSPNSIVKAQTGKMCYLWFESPGTLADWIRVSQAHQAWVVEWMTNAFRRNMQMNTFAVHQGIDAFPAGWMKAILDVERHPKPAYFAYRDALEPLMVHLRCDRRTLFSGEKIHVEAWLCNDEHTMPPGLRLQYQLEAGRRVLSSGRSGVRPVKFGSEFLGYISLQAPRVKKQQTIRLRVGLVDSNSRTVRDATVCFDVYPAATKSQGRIVVVDSTKSPVARMVGDLGFTVATHVNSQPSDVILVGDWKKFCSQRRTILAAVRQGATLVLLEMPEGKHRIGGDAVGVQKTMMNPQHFVSCRTGHPLVSDFPDDAFKLWYDENVEYISPILKTTLHLPDGWRSILTAANRPEGAHWMSEAQPSPAAAERSLGKGRVRVCQVSLPGRVNTNPTARRFASRLISAGNQ